MRKVIISIYFIVSILAVYAQPKQFKTISEALSQPWSKTFFIERKAGKYAMADTFSHFNNNKKFENLTFDISNNKVLANMGIQGGLKNVTVYRDSYFASCDPASGWPGVWTAKDNSSFGTYQFSLELDGQKYFLDSVNWDFRTGLLDNIFPISELKEPSGKCKITLIAYAPISSDGGTRSRAIVYGLLLQNTYNQTISGAVNLPRLFTKKRAEEWASKDPYDYELYHADNNSPAKDVAFSLKTGESVWVPLIFNLLGDNDFEDIQKKGSLTCLNDTWTYFRKILGTMQTPNNRYLGDFYERQMMEAFGSIAMSASGKIAGSNWGSYPTTRQIWMKDFFYSALPFMASDPELAKSIILWFNEFGVRPKGSNLEGGVMHSIGLSVGSIMLSGMYYNQTGDKQFFISHPELKEKWVRILNELQNDAKYPDTWLFKSRYISDGAIEADYHTGSNVCVWQAFESYSRIMREVYHDTNEANRYQGIASKIHASILEKTIIEGPFGKQFIEGTYVDGHLPAMESDGEESDIALMPFYGFLPYDDSVYQNYMKFSVSPYNIIYNPKVHAIKWFGKPAEKATWSGVPSTAPGYVKGICATSNFEKLFGKTGYFNEIRRVTDADGSVWWWSYGGNANGAYGDVERGVPGKAGWFSGSYTSVFVNRFFGISYDAVNEKFSFAPLSAIGDLSWNDFPIGNQRFSVSCKYDKGKVTANFQNPNQTAKHLEVILPIGISGKYKVKVNGQILKVWQKVDYLEGPAASFKTEVPANGSVEFELLNE